MQLVTLNFVATFRISRRDPLPHTFCFKENFLEKIEESLYITGNSFPYNVLKMCI